MKTRILNLTLILCFGCLWSLQGEIRLPKVFGNNMVLQQGKKVPVWGWCEPAQTLTVSLAGQTAQAISDGNGRWEVILKPLKTSHEPSQMTIETSHNKVVLENILVGEVWLASGQSNMEYTMKLHPGYKKPQKGEDMQAKELREGHNPLIRLFLVEKKLDTPELPTQGWQICSEESLSPFSAPAYFFAKNICDSLKVPVGIIASSWGGSRIEVWTPAQAYLSSPLFKHDIDPKTQRIDAETAGRYYNKMIEPIIPFALRGFLWYQGESNIIALNETLRYTDKQNLLIESWRTLWRDDKLPLYYVQLAPYNYTRRKDNIAHSDKALPLFWQAQQLGLKTPYTGMTTITDLVDDTKEIHPPYKWEVGRRLALIALAKDYGYKKLEYSGPVLQKTSIKDGKVTLTFTHTQGGLKSIDRKPLDWFEVAGADGIFTPAKAVIEGNKIIVWNEQTTSPVKVRFAWDEKATPNLFNGAGLPAVPFCTSL